MNNHTEVEARWINISRADIDKKLEKIGAKKRDDFFRHRLADTNASEAPLNTEFVLS